MTSPITSNSMSWLIQYKLEMRRSMHQTSTIYTSYICAQLPYWDLSRCLLCRLCFYNPMAPVLMHTCFFNIFLQFWWYWCSLLLSWFDWWNEILDLGFAINSKSGIFRDDCLNLANAEQEQFVLTLDSQFNLNPALSRVQLLRSGVGNAGQGHSCVYVCKCVYICMYIFDITGRVSWAWLCCWFWWC